MLGRSLSSKWMLVLCLTFTAAVLHGCQGDSAPEQEDTGGDDDSSASSDSDSRPKSGRPDNKARTLVHTDADGRKWIGDIPYDVWLDDPLQVASDDGTVTDTEPTDDPPTEPMETVDTGDGDSPPASAAGWAELIPLDVLAAEVKKVNNRLTANLISAGKFNGNQKEVQVDGDTLAAMAVIAIEHEEGVPWKNNAKYVREIGSQISDAAQELGREAFEKAQIPHEQLVAILNREDPVGLPEVDERVDVADVARRGGLMTRMETGWQWLKSEVDSEEALKEKSEDARHEAWLLVALSKTIAGQEFSSGDEEEYQAYGKRMLETSQTAARAIEAEDFATFMSGIQAARKVCNECHDDYRFADDF